MLFKPMLCKNQLYLLYLNMYIFHDLAISFLDISPIEMRVYIHHNVQEYHSIFIHESSNWKETKLSGKKPEGTFWGDENGLNPDIDADCIGICIYQN